MAIVKKSKTFQTPKGMHDILPEDQKYWRYVAKKVESLLEDYGFEKIETPVLESADLFRRGVGEDTDVVGKEMYTLKTRGGDELSLKPENTAAVVRAYLEHGMQVRPQPVKLFYNSSFFRHDQPQKGRYRQFHQIGAETLGDASEIVDAELLFLAHKIIESLGVKNHTLTINTIGDQNCRPAYLKALRDYYKTRIKKICVQCRVRVKENVLRALDCKEEICREVRKDAPQIMDYLDGECKNHFKHVLEFLDEAQIPYLIDPYLVRGLDYYTRTVFEFLPDDQTTSQSSLLSGGRYDRLVDLLGGQRTPAAGWAMGLERVIEVLKDQQTNVPEAGLKPKVFLVQLGDVAKRRSLLLFEDIRRAGIEVKSSLGRDSIKAQLRIAHRLGVRFALIFGQQEAIDRTVIIREMDTGVQETVPVEKIVDELKKRLKK